jgi:hypothetical protein
MALREVLAERQAALCGRWLSAVLEDYGRTTASRWLRERDPFANPVGHVLRTALPTLLASVAGEGEMGPEALAALEAVVRLRSVQALAPSLAVGFVYRLRDVLREELEADSAGGGLGAELAAAERRIERLALLAFDAYVLCREEVHRLRQEELKRSVGSILRRWHGGGEALPDELVRLSLPPNRNAVR